MMDIQDHADGPVAIPATRRQAKELVDGTLAVTLHIDPPYKAAFHRLFPEIDTPVAIAPIKIGPTPTAAPTTVPMATPTAPTNPNKVSPQGAGDDLAPQARNRSRSGPREASTGPLCQLAAIWCRDVAFQDWLCLQTGQAIYVGDDAASAEDTAKIVRSLCGVASRRDLDTDPTAAAKFDHLIRHPYQKYLARRSPQGVV